MDPVQIALMPPLKRRIRALATPLPEIDELEASGPGPQSDSRALRAEATSSTMTTMWRRLVMREP